MCNLKELCTLVRVLHMSPCMFECSLRKLLHSMEDLPAIEFLIDKLKVTKTNDEFFTSMKRQKTGKIAS